MTDGGGEDATMNSSDQTDSQKARALEDLVQALYSSLSGLSASSRTIPSERDFHFYRNFDDFKAPIGEIAEKSASLLQAIGSSAVALGKDVAFPEDLEDAYDWLVSVNDEAFEQFDASADEFRRVRKEEEESGKRVMEVDGGFQLVYGKKKNKAVQGSVNRTLTDSVNGRGESSVKVASLKEKVGGPKPKVPFHIPTIRRSQEEFSISVNNTNQPFQHVWLQKSEDEKRFIHPLVSYRCHV